MKNIRFILCFGVLVACFPNPLFLEDHLRPIPKLRAAMGFFSSRTTIEKRLRLSYRTQRDLYGEQSWGFREQ